MTTFRYLRAADFAEASLREAVAAIGEPALSIPPDSWMAQRGWRRIYDHHPPLGPNQRYVSSVSTVEQNHVDRRWEVGQDMSDADYDALLAAAARSAINAWRNDQEDAGFAAIGHAWDSTPRSREKLAAVVMAGQGSPLGIWTSAADVDVPVTAEDLLAIYAAMLTRGAQIHARQRELKAAVATMTREQLAAFVPGWPE